MSIQISEQDKMPKEELDKYDELEKDLKFTSLLYTYSKLVELDVSLDEVKFHFGVIE